MGEAGVPIPHGTRGRLLHSARDGARTRDLPGARAPDASRRGAGRRAGAGVRGGGAETVALSREEIAPAAPQDESSPAGIKSETPSETSERLSEGVGALRDKAEEIIEELDRLEARLEAAEVEQLALRETASREKARAEKLQAELDAAKSDRQAEQGGSWRRLFRR